MCMCEFHYAELTDAARAQKSMRGVLGALRAPRAFRHSLTLGRDAQTAVAYGVSSATTHH